MSSLVSRLAHYRALSSFVLGNVLYPTLKVESVDLTGKTAIVSGANVGIGLEIARKLAAMGAHVVLACRNAEKAEKAKEDIIQSTGSRTVEVRVVDFCSFASVRTFVEEWNGRPLDILINNAGMCPARFNLAEDGYESIYTADFLSHFLFTTLLLPSFTSNARIINVSSIMHYWVGHEYLSVEDLDSSKFLAEKGVKEGDVMAAHADMLYSKAKLSQVVWGRVLGEKLTESEKYREKGIFVASCHPGLVTSTIWYRNGGISPDMDKMQARVQGIIKRLGVSTEQGACTPVFLAVDPSAPRTGGVYWDRQQACTPNALVFDEKLGEKLWAAWMRACRLSEI